jgi:hypothetical protein
MTENGINITERQGGETERERENEGRKQRKKEKKIDHFSKLRGRETDRQTDR